MVMVLPIDSLGTGTRFKEEGKIYQVARGEIISYHGSSSWSV